MLVDHRFWLNENTAEKIRSLEPEFGYDGFGEFVFYRTYSRVKPNGLKESWHDVVIRVVEGTMSIRKNHYIKNNIDWDESYWQHYAYHFTIYLFKMYWLPPGRGLWAMGTEFVYEHGSMPLCNCGFTVLEDSSDFHWMMDALMNGMGVGFRPLRDPHLLTYIPKGESRYVIEDSREGWCNSTQHLIEAFLHENSVRPTFIYDEIRPYGSEIKRFGGTASGPKPLIELHKKIEKFFYLYRNEPWYDSVMLKTDIANAIGVCVVAGNVRRSAEIGCAPLSDPVFLDLKNYDLYPHRASIGWMSNNSVYLESNHDFNRISEIAERVIRNGEPGIINLRNLTEGRIGKKPIKEDKAMGFNPCGEQPLEDKEICTLVESLPTRCPNLQTWHQALEYATFYASTVSLLPTHRSETNAVLLRNRRIGVGIIDYTGMVHQYGMNETITNLKKGYQRVREVNKWLNTSAGVPEAIRVTTVKPGGTTPKLAGKTSGSSYPTYKYTLRRVRVGASSNVVPLLIEAGYPYEEDVNLGEGTLVFSFPIIQGPAKTSEEVSIFEQAINVVTLQREWSDNAVSNTIYFRPKWELQAVVSKDEFMSSFSGVRNLPDWKIETDEDGQVRVYKHDDNHEEDVLEFVLSSTVPLIKSLSLLPKSPEGVYAQMPESKLTKVQYDEMKSRLKPIDWSRLTNEDSVPEKYCEGDTCQV